MRRSLSQKKPTRRRYQFRFDGNRQDSVKPWKYATFERASVAYDSTGQQVAQNIPVYEEV